MNKPYKIQNTNICNSIFHISFFKALLINECEKRPGAKWNRGETTHGANGIRGEATQIPLVQSGQVSGSDVESWYGYYTVLLLTLRYVHELSIRRLLFVYTCTTEGQCKNLGAVVVVIVR